MIVETPVEHDGIWGPLATVWCAQKVVEALQVIGHLLGTTIATPQHVLNQCHVGHGGSHKGRVPIADQVPNHKHALWCKIWWKLCAWLAHTHTHSVLPAAVSAAVVE
eukprot:10208818-Ditylum_brightwellii.AAC.1